MSRLLKIAATALLMVPAVMFAFPASVQAADKGQIEGGNIYRVKNVTKNTDFTDPVSADACNILQYWIRVHNPGPSGLTNVNVKTTLPSGVSNSHTSVLTASSTSADPQSTSDTAIVNLSSAQSLAYINGSTQLLDAEGKFIKTLPDSITAGGVNIGSVGVSINEKRFVYFKAKVNCPEPPKPEVKFACEALGVVKIDRTRFDFTATASVKNANVTSYVFTARDGEGHIVDTKTVNTSALSAVYNFNQSKAGDYTVSVIVNTDKGSTHVTDKCTQKVTVVKEEEKPTPPAEEKPEVKGEVTELPNTGAAAIGVFAGASVLGTAGHYLFRRFRA